jgi:hypothetical protein
MPEKGEAQPGTPALLILHMVPDLVQENVFYQITATTLYSPAANHAPADSLHLHAIAKLHTIMPFEVAGIGTTQCELMWRPDRM